MAPKLAIIGGSGIYDNPLFKDSEWKKFDTKYLNTYGDGIIEYQATDEIIFIPRHGRSKKYGPHNTQYAANMIAAKTLGADRVIAVSAVGSLVDHIEIAELVVPDDYVDETNRNETIFKSLVMHTMPHPAFSEELRKILIDTGKKYFIKVHDKATYVAIPGDRFGTIAECKKRALYSDIVGMTLCPEASIAMQLGMHYAVAAIPVDKGFVANHEDKTLAVMSELSRPNHMPAYIQEVARKALNITLPSRLEQLKGNIIVGDISREDNDYLRQIAAELVEKYVIYK